MNKIKLIVGLGNPGKEYEYTRHNVGFIFINEITEKFGVKKFNLNKKVFSAVANFKNKHEIFLAKPQTFMNKSGTAVAALVKFFKIKPENILIVHDDIDILWGSFKFSFGRSSAGHRGVESVIKALKTKNFWRLRLGIQPRIESKNKKQGTRVRADKIILKKFTPKELDEFDKIMKKAIRQLADSFL